MNYRSPKILRAAADSPRCFACLRGNDGTVVAAHSNQQRDGKGMGVKAHDYRVAFVCSECHTDIDHAKDRELSQQLWEAAHRKTIGWLFESGTVK